MKIYLNDECDTHYIHVQHLKDSLTAVAVQISWKIGYFHALPRRKPES